MSVSISNVLEYKINAKDGYQISVVKYSTTANPRGRLIVAGATGVPQGFYRRFAEFVASEDIEVWTLDYRGIGSSKPKDLKGFQVDILDWAQLDLTALIDHVVANYDGPLWLVGHSFGGHAFGLIPNPNRFLRFATFGTGAAWHGWMPNLERFRVQILWNIVGPLIVMWNGFLAWSILGMGEDLPKNVFLQWRHWSSFPHYFFDDPKMKGIKDLFARVNIPIRAINSIDDKWASPAARDAFMWAYKNSQIERVDLNPKNIGMNAIGHMSYFRPGAKKLWQETLDWLTHETNGPLK
jgi:predicted alpha/beta hydrolase